jgi:LysR family transcriptional regulator, benzoate and cis,cis-muconate-responsive activator of ben and cat genes
MEFRQIKYFLGVAEDLHFSRASERLYIAQSALSRQIQQLESEINIKLFDRDKRNVKLTPAGEFLKNEWKRMTNEADDILRHARQINSGEVGRIRLGHPGSAIYSILPKALGIMQQQIPDVKIELIEITELELIDGLLNYQIDVGLTREISSNPILESRSLFAENFALVVNQSHRLVIDNFKSLKQTRDEKFILPTFRENSAYSEHIVSIFRQHGFKPKKAFESNFGATILKLIEQNLGISIMPISYAKGAPANVRFIPLPDISELFITWRKTDLNPALKKTIKIFEDEGRRF